MLTLSTDRYQKQIQRVKEYAIENKWKTAFLAGSSTLVLLCSRYIYNKLRRKLKSYPDGPEGFLPFIGFGINTLLNQSWHINVAMTYGPIVLLQTFLGQTVLINDSKIAKELLYRKDMQYRDPSAIIPFTHLVNSIPFPLLNGKEWKKRRQIMHSKLIRMLNTKFVNEILTQIIKTELEPYLQNVIKNENKIWYPRAMAIFLSFNTIYQANFGKIITVKNDNIYKQFSQDLTDFFSPKVAVKFNLLNLFPLLKYSPLVNSLEQRRERLNNNTKLLMERRNNVNPNEDEMTFVDHIKELRDKGELNEGKAIVDVLFMFIGGTDTTSNTLEYGIALIAKQTDIQCRVRKELQDNITNDSSNIVFDINLLLKVPLFRALIHEILRISCIVKLNVPHFIIDNDIWINNYCLPKNSHVIFNIDYIHNYSENESWKSGTKYICLENWLNNDNKFAMNPSFLTFGYNKRDCVGQQLALKELRIVLGYLLLNYKFKLKNPNQEIKDVGGRGFGTAELQPQIPVMIQKI